MQRVRLWALAVAAVATVGAFTFYEVADLPTTGDEPHYLVYARSLAEGWGLDLTQAYEFDNYRVFHAGVIEPHARYYAGPDGRLATWHGIGLPSLLAPAIAFSPSIVSARLVLLVIYALLVYNLYRLVLTVTETSRVASATAVLAIALSIPTIGYSTQVYPEVTAALLLVVSFRALVSNRTPWVRYGGAAVAASLLVWLSLRYATLTAGLLVIAALAALGRKKPRSLRRALAALLPAILPAAIIGGLLVAFNLELYGGVAPPLELRPGTVGYLRPENLYLYGVGALVGVPGGLVPLAPVTLVALLASAVAARVIARGRLLAAVLVAGGYVAFNAFFGSPGFALPGRYLVAVVPLLAVPLAVAWSRGRRVARTAIVALVGATMIATVMAAQHSLDLYTAETAHLQPLSVTQDVFPFVLSDFRTAGLSFSGPDALQGIGRVEEIGGQATGVARAFRNPPGILAIGGFHVLLPGRYVARFSLWSDGSAPQVNAGTVDVAEIWGRRIVGRDIGPLPNGGTRIDLPFTTDGEVQVGLRVFFADGVLGVLAIEATLIRPFPVRRASDEWWKATLWIAGGAAVAMTWVRIERKRAKRPPLTAR